MIELSLVAAAISFVPHHTTTYVRHLWDQLVVFPEYFRVTWVRKYSRPPLRLQIVKVRICSKDSVYSKLAYGHYNILGVVLPVKNDYVYIGWEIGRLLRVI